jgi:hypothetical protein
MLGRLQVLDKVERRVSVCEKTIRASENSHSLSPPQPPLTDAVWRQFVTRSNERHAHLTPAGV